MKFFIATVAISLVISCVQATLGFGNCTEHFIGDFMPAQLPKAVEICRDGYIAISYTPYLGGTTVRNPAWAAYRITTYDVEHSISGRLSFYEDPDLKKADIPQASVDAEVFGNEWNRGHLCPSRINSYSEAGKKSTYTMSNIAPQLGREFNQRVWMYLETDIFDWIGENEELYIVTGVANDQIPPSRIVDGVAIPDYYWKVICQPKYNQSVGFYGWNEASQVGRREAAKAKKEGNPNPLRMYDFVTVEEVEKLYGGKLFPADVCATGKVDQSFWGWSAKSYSRGARVPFSAFADNTATLKQIAKEHRADFLAEKKN